MKHPRKPLLLSLCAAPAASDVVATITGGDCNVIEAAPAADGAAAGPPKLDMVIYTGGPIRPRNNLTLKYPIVVDLSGLELPTDQRPILKDHNPALHVGHIDPGNFVNNGHTLAATGVVSGKGPAAREVAGASKDGFRWRVSFGLGFAAPDFVPAGSTVKVNGQLVAGPVYVARSSYVREVSVLTLGADDNTSARIAATAAEGTLMTFEQWLKAKGFTLDALSDQQKSTLEAAFTAETAAAADKDADKDKKTDKDKQLDATDDDDAGEDPVKAARAAALAENKRIASIGKVATKFRGRVPAERLAELEAAAIDDGGDVRDFELSLHREAMPQATNARHGGRGPAVTGAVLEAALCMSLGLPDVEKQFKPDVLDAAHKKKTIGLQETLMLAACANGYNGSPGERVTAGNLREVLGFAFPRGQRTAGDLDAAFSNISLPGILSNVANKELLTGYMEEDQTWREVAQVKTVNDFKQVTSYRMLDDMEYEELAPDGRIAHGKLGEESYTRQAKTYAKMFGLSRTNIINDDLGAFDDLRRRLGAGAGKKFNNIFWAKFLANSSFFTTGRVNYITGATTNLLVDGVGLQLGITAFRKLRSPAADGEKRLGNTVGGRPDRLLVPPELEFAAERLYQSTQVNTGGAATAESVGNTNIHAGKYRPIVCDWLSDADFTGYSTTAWYLLRNPAMLAAAVVSFLNGQQAPTVESTDADFDQLGILFRGYHDFGVDLAEYLCGIKSKGAA
jgi:phage major head subunit gpT-like protein